MIKTSLGISEVLDKWGVSPELLFHLLSTDPYWERLMPKLHGNRCLQSFHWSKWKCDYLTMTCFFENQEDHMNILLDLCRQTCRRSTVLKMKVKRENSKSFAVQQESPNVLCHSLVAVHQQTSKGRIPNIVWQFEWVDLGEVFDFTMLKKKNVWWYCMWTVPGASGWLGEAGKRPCWSEQS